MRTIFDEYKDIENDYKTGTIEIAEGLPFSQYQTLRTVEFYTNSKFLNGQTDSLSREKPFHNIVNANVDVAIVATDIDSKDIDVTSDNPGEYTKSFILRRLVYNWMLEADFGRTLNDMGDTRPRYGGVLVKKLMEDYEGEEKLKIEVIAWGNSTTDPKDIENGTIIETYTMNPEELAAKNGVWDNVPEAMKMFRSEKGKYKDIKIVDMHGVFPKSYLTDSPDPEDIEFTRQHHILAVKSNLKYVWLWHEEEKENPYMYCPWKPTAKRSLGRGVVEEGDEAQVWTNDAAIAEKNAMELGSKLLYKTTSKKLGNNVTTDVNNGHIFQLEMNTDINPVNTLTNAIPEFNNLIERWGRQFDRSTAVTDALRGETPPAGQAYRLGALVTQQSASQFDYRREDMGLFLKRMFGAWVIPYLVKKYSKDFTLASDLFSEEELKKIDENFATSGANSAMIDEAIENLKDFDAPISVSDEKYNRKKDEFSNTIKQSGKKRYMKVPKDYFKDIECRVTINTTGEQRNKMATLESLSTILTTAASNPAILQDPNLKAIFDRILELSGAGISPIQMSATDQAQMVQEQQMMESPFQAPGGQPLPGPQAITAK